MIRETSRGKITEQELSEDLNIRLDNVDTHIADTNNPHAVSVGQIGAEPSGSVSTHNSAIDAHSDIRSELLSLSDDIPSDPLPREADTLEGHNASYYTTYSDTAVSNHNISGTAHSDIRSQLAQIPPNGAVMTNLVTNGDFSNGTTGWYSQDSTQTASSNTLINTGSGSNKDIRINKNLGISAAINKKVYYRISARVTNSLCSSITLYTYNGSNASNMKSLVSPAINTWYNISDIFIHGDLGSSMSLWIRESYPDAATANGKVMEVQYVTAIDLTATFGAGNEPTAAQMDELLAFYDNSWFNGNANITDLLQYVVSRKANIAQEAWIVPTLKNSWANFNSATHSNVGYMKDNFGFVHIKGLISSGTVGVSAFQLPTGYRPLRALTFPVMGANALGKISVETDGNITMAIGSSTMMSLEGLCFYAGVA